MKRVVLAAILSLLALPAMAQSATAPGSLGGDQVGTGAVEPQRDAGGSGSGSAGTAITSSPSADATASLNATGSTNTAGAGSTSTGSGSSGGAGGGGGHGGGMQALCLSTGGSVADVNADEFGLDCPQ